MNRNNRRIPHIRSNAELEARLNQTVRPDTNLMELLMIARCGRYWSNPIYIRAGEQVRETLKRRYEERWATLSDARKMREGKLMGSLQEPYLNGDFRTILELKEILETKGFIYRRIGPGVVAILNSFLREYRVETISKVKGHSAGPSYLEHYGLKRLETYSR